VISLILYRRVKVNRHAGKEAVRSRTSCRTQFEFYSLEHY